MKIIKTFKDKENWFETTEEELVAKTHDIYPNPMQVLKDVGIIQSMWAIWKLEERDECNFCGSTDLIYNQSLLDSSCQECGEWQEGELITKTK